MFRVRLLSATRTQLLLYAKVSEHTAEDQMRRGIINTKAVRQRLGKYFGRIELGFFSGVYRT